MEVEWGKIEKKLTESRLKGRDLTYIVLDAMLELFITLIALEW